MNLLQIMPHFLLSLPGGAEWLWIVLIIVVLFGGRKIPELARGLGKGIKEFKDAKEGDDKEGEKKKGED
ncbi:MAG: twin-arginine translocase TatA/TatE family subunit [Edaphocola sp.]